jgi:integrase
MVPLHPSTVAALKTYLARRDQLFANPSTAGLFISTTATRLRAGNRPVGILRSGDYFTV